MVRELSGQSGAKGPYIYFPNRGRFDNLGLYEILRRRCRFIFSVDAGRGQDDRYLDIGHVLQSASIDLGVQARFRKLPKIKEANQVAGFLIADIDYPPERPGESHESDLSEALPACERADGAAGLQGPACGFSDLPMAAAAAAGCQNAGTEGLARAFFCGTTRTKRCTLRDRVASPSH